MSDWKHRFMPHREERFPVSRDYAMEVGCDNKRCPMQSAFGCASPAAVRIDTSGRCTFWVRVKEQEK